MGGLQVGKIFPIDDSHLDSNEFFDNSQNPEADPNFLREIADGLYERAEEIEEEQKVDPPAETGDIVRARGLLPMIVTDVFPSEQQLEIRYITGAKYKEIPFEAIEEVFDPVNEKEQRVEDMMRALKRAYQDKYPDYF